MPYTCDIEDCDVIDKKTLVTFRQRRDKWDNWLRTDSHHAMQLTLSSMIWADVSFRTLMHIAVSNSGSALHNQLLTEFLYNGHASAQILGIRRLMDTGRNVISLPRLIADVRRSASCITRENFICFDGLPYDYEAVKTRIHARMLADAETRAKSPSAAPPGIWQPSTGPDAYWPSEMAHQEFDNLSGARPENRKRTDCVSLRIFDRLSDWLAASDSDDLVNWSHAYLAHAATPESPNRLRPIPAPTLDKMTNAIKHFVRVSEALGMVILASGHGQLVPTAQFDRFAYLDYPIMSAANVASAAACWDALAAERESYIESIAAELVV